MSTRSGYLDLSGEDNLMLDMAALIAVPWFASFIFGVFSFSLNIFGGYDFSQPIWTVAGIELSAALLIVMAGLVWIVATNELDGSDYESWEFAIIGFALLSPLMYVTLTEFQALVEYHDITRLMATLLLTGATTYISYTE